MSYSVRLSGFQMTVENLTNHNRNSAMNQSEFLANTCNSLEAREKSRVQGAIGFASHWLKNWRETSSPIAGQFHFDSRLKNRSIA